MKAETARLIRVRPLPPAHPAASRVLLRPPPAARRPPPAARARRVRQWGNLFTTGQLDSGRAAGLLEALGAVNQHGVDETCPISKDGWTRRVHFVREGGEEGVCGGFCLCWLVA